MNAIAPATEPERATVSTFSPRMPDAALRLRIALVDDDEVFGALFLSGLRQLGLDATHFASTGHAARALQQESFDVIVVDWQIGAGTSESLIRQWVNDRCAGAKVRLIVLSGHIEPCGHCLDADLRELIDSYGLEWRAKPYSVRALAGELARGPSDWAAA